MNKTFYEEGIEEGIERGMERGFLDCAINVLEGRFGPLPPKILADLKSRTRQELQSMITNIFRIISLEELDFNGLK